MEIVNKQLHLPNSKYDYVLSIKGMCLINENDKVLVLKSRKEPLYKLPSVVLNDNVSLISNLVKSVRDELGINVKLFHDNYFSLCQVTQHDCIIYINYHALIISGRPYPRRDVVDIIWVDAESCAKYVDTTTAHVISQFKPIA